MSHRDRVAHPLLSSRVFGLAIAEQFVSSVSTFVFVVLAARALSVDGFGTFSIAWSLVMLVETVAWALLGETMPALAHRAPLKRWPEVRGAIFVLSAIIFVVLVGGMLVAAAAVAGTDSTLALLLVVSAIAVAGLRAQQLFRRLCYLDERRALSFAGALVYSTVLFGGFFSLHAVTAPSAATMVLCWGLAMWANGAMSLMVRVELGMPSRRMLRWFFGRSLQSGRWLMPSGLLYWTINMGLIPVAGVFFGLQASGTMRLLQNLMSPLTQLVAALGTVVGPRAAKMLRQRTPGMVDIIVARYTMLFAGVALLYAVILVIAGEPLMHWLFIDDAKLISTAAITAMAVAGVAEAIRTGGAVVLTAMNVGRPVFMARVLANAALVGTCLILMSSIGFLTLPLAFAAGNVVAAAYVVTYMKRPGRVWRSEGRR